MCKLRFNYTDERHRVTEVVPVNIPDEERQNFEKIVNEKWQPICEDVNKVGGYVKVSVSQDATKILRAVLILPDWFHHLLKDRNLNNDVDF